MGDIIDGFRNRPRIEYSEPPEIERPVKVVERPARRQPRAHNIDLPMSGSSQPDAAGTAYKPEETEPYAMYPEDAAPPVIIGFGKDGSTQAEPNAFETTTAAAAQEFSGKTVFDYDPIIPYKLKQPPKPVSRGIVPVGRDDALKLDPPAEPETVPVRDIPKSSPDQSRREPPLDSAPDTSFGEDVTAALEAETNDTYQFPPLSLLVPGQSVSTADNEIEMRENITMLQDAFRSFGVNLTITAATRGPSVTRYEAELESGMKLARVANLSDDIALRLGSQSVRIAPMPDKRSTVGIEVPNRFVSTVQLRDIIESKAFCDAPGKLTFAIGKNIPGEAIVGNISKLPHLLIAGTTGSGKSVCLNSLILSLLYKATPEEVRLIMIDPKMVEFSVYNGIPHLLTPVVTDPKKASGALQWAVVEMEKRYRYFSECGARDLESYNRYLERSGESPMFQLVVIIDELADLMMTAGKEVEDSIVRVAQKGRAAGVHLVIATQSPRREVITGLMKANIPSRIALKVSSALESRIILDTQGAEKLVGNGDMLYVPTGTARGIRVQGTFFSEPERFAVVEFIKRGGEAEYEPEVAEEIERAAYASEKVKGKGGNGAASYDSGDEDFAVDADFDELMPKAAEVIFESGQASTSMLQRRLRLGYARAARIIDQLETVGLLGPFEGSKARQVLLTREQWNSTRYAAPGAADQTCDIESEDEEDAPPWD